MEGSGFGGMWRVSGLPFQHFLEMDNVLQSSECEDQFEVA